MAAGPGIEERVGSRVELAADEVELRVGEDVSQGGGVLEHLHRDAVDRVAVGDERYAPGEPLVERAAVGGCTCTRNRATLPQPVEQEPQVEPCLDALGLEAFKKPVRSLVLDFLH